MTKKGNQHFLIYCDMKKAASVIVLLALVFITGCKDGGKTIDETIIGNWKTSEAQVNVADAPAEMKKAFEQMILNTKYEFNADKSFIMTSEREDIKGSWSFDKERNALLLVEGLDDKAARDTFNIEASTENSISLNSNMGADGSISFTIERIVSTKDE